MTAVAGAVGRFALRLASPRVAPVVVLALMAAFFGNGFIGIDFGSHWDEWYHTATVSDCIERLSLLPSGVSYGGPYFTLGFPVIVSHEWSHLIDLLRDLRIAPRRMDLVTLPSMVRFKASALALVASARYVLQVRTIFLAVSSLSALWMFLAVRRGWPRRTGAALAGAAFMAMSWELGYHARWLAIDAPLAQFASLQLFLFVGAWRAGSHGRAVRWYCATAAAAGAVFACKMTGGFALFPVILTPLLRPAHWRPAKRLALMLLGCGVFTLTAFVLSPQWFFNPLQVLHALRGGTDDYNNIPTNYTYYVGLTEHVGRVLVWFGGAVPSPFPMVALPFTAVGLVGLASLLRRETRMTLAWVSFPAAFIYAFSRNHMLIVRQYLMCMPFLAFCFARGAAVCWDFLRTRDRRAGGVFVTAIVAGLAANEVFDGYRGWLVTRDSAEREYSQVVADLRANRDGVRMSQAVLDILMPRLGGALSCHPTDKSDKRVTHAITGWAEYFWMSNRLFGFRHAYGAAEVNLNYYASWFGRSVGFRLLDVAIDKVNAAEPATKAPNFDCLPVDTVASQGPGRRAAVVGLAAAGQGG